MTSIPDHVPGVGVPLAGRLHARDDLLIDVREWAQWWAKKVWVARMRPGRPVEVDGALAAAILILLDCEEAGGDPAVREMTWSEVVKNCGLYGPVPREGRLTS